jgi:CheY-like chemotaxis protein
MEKDNRPVMHVVEDEPLVRLNMVDLAEDIGYRTVEAGSGDDAIKIIDNGEDVSVVVTDINMPGMNNGLALARHVRDRWPPTVIHLLGRRTATRDLPPNAIFLTKPCTGPRIERCSTASRWSYPIWTWDRLSKVLATRDAA